MDPREDLIHLAYVDLILNSYFARKRRLPHRIHSVRDLVHLVRNLSFQALRSEP